MPAIPQLFAFWECSRIRYLSVSLPKMMVGNKNYALFDDKIRVRGHGAAMEFCSGGIFYVWRNGVA